MQFAILPLFADANNNKLIVSTGLGGEVTGSSRDNIAVGGLLQVDFRFWGGLCLGAKGGYSTNFDSVDDSVQALDVKAFLRIYPLDFSSLNTGVFLQGEAGRLFAWESMATTKHAAGEMISGWSYGGTLGARFAFPPGYYGNFYLEPFARMGAPILWSGGIVAGYSFHSVKNNPFFVYTPQKNKPQYTVFMPAPRVENQTLPKAKEPKSEGTFDATKDQYEDWHQEQEPYTEPSPDQYNQYQYIAEPRIVERYIIESQEIIAVEYHHNDIKLAVRDGEPHEFSIAEVFFYKDSASFFGLKRGIIQQNKKILDMAAEFLNAHPDYSLCVEGHANPTTKAYSAARNREELQALQPLALLRAEVIADMLVARGVPVSRLYVRSNGGMKTVVPLEDKAGWWKNRRAEFTLYK
jgi:outer membrane protein OmpA-like peptidoglycan-associated protein